MYGKQGGCLEYVIAIVAALSVRDPLLREAVLTPEDEEESNHTTDDMDTAENNANADAKTKKKEAEG